MRVVPRKYFFEVFLEFQNTSELQENIDKISWHIQDFKGGS